MNNQWFSKIAVWLVIALVLFTVFKQLDRSAVAGKSVGYSDFLEEVRNKRIKQVKLKEVATGGTEIRATTVDGDTLRTMLAALRRLLKVTPINTVVMRRRIADETVTRGGYIF